MHSADKYNSKNLSYLQDFKQKRVIHHTVQLNALIKRNIPNFRANYGLAIMTSVIFFYLLISFNLLCDAMANRWRNKRLRSNQTQHRVM